MSGAWWVLHRGARRSHYLAGDDGTALCGQRLGRESEGGKPERLTPIGQVRDRCESCAKKLDRLAAAPPDPESETQ